MKRSHIHTGAVVLFLVAVSLAIPLAGIAAADSDATIEAEPDSANATANHTATVVVGEESAGNLSAVELNYSDTNTSLDLVTENIVVGIDRGNDSDGTEVDEDVTANLTTVGFGADPGQVTLQFDGTVDVQSGDQVVITLVDVQNPQEEGEYTVTLDVNPDRDGEPAEATLSIGPAEDTGNETETGTETETDEETPGGDGDGGDGDDDGGTDGGAPGFGVTAALAAVAAAALLALRRRA